MKHSQARGTALPETALTIGLSLLLVLGAAQMALIGYTQISADGAAFVAAHEQAQNPAINGATEGASVFSAFNNGNFSTPSPQPSLIPFSVSKSVGGFALIPGVASAYTVTGKDVEYAPDSASATPAPYQFSVSATLVNYCDPHGSCSLPNTTYTIYLAQGVGNGNGNGANGIFSEWRCHQKYYASLNWPNSYPTGKYNAIKGTQFDPYSNNSTENTIYGWDSGNPKCN
jgi:hypothetical protein